jgi:hypothetical protein
MNGPEIPARKAIDGKSEERLGIWILMAYISFGAWLLHSFAVKALFLSVHQLVSTL